MCWKPWANFQAISGRILSPWSRSSAMRSAPISNLPRQPSSRRRHPKRDTSGRKYFFRRGPGCARASAASLILLSWRERKSNTARARCRRPALRTCTAAATAMRGKPSGYACRAAPIRVAPNRNRPKQRAGYGAWQWCSAQERLRTKYPPQAPCEDAHSRKSVKNLISAAISAAKSPRSWPGSCPAAIAVGRRTADRR